MALIILEGLDRTGKSSVAQMFERQGYEIMHISAPTKGTTADQYVGEWVDLLTGIQGRDIVLDRSHYGELVWPQVYGRAALLNDEAIEILREIEANMEITRILMFDHDSAAHWQRCVDNNEPLTKPQFVKARALFSNMADKYGFERKQLKDFPDAVQALPNDKSQKNPASTNETPAASTEAVGSDKTKTREQQKLERANIINDVLSRRIIKGKGAAYDEVERAVRHFLNQELGKILGSTTNTPGLTNEEVELLKFFCQRLKEKEN
jgi:thymidylate kinase